MAARRTLILSCSNIPTGRPPAGSFSTAPPARRSSAGRWPQLQYSTSPDLGSNAAYRRVANNSAALFLIRYAFVFRIASIAPGIGEGRSHATWGGYLADRANRPVR